MAKKLSKRAYNKIISIARAKTEQYRSKLDKKIHVADISFSAMQNSVKQLNDVEYGVIYSALQNAATNNSKSLRYSISMVKSKRWKGLTFVDDPKFGQFLLGSSYNTLQTYISPVFKNLTKQYSNLSPLMGTDKYGRTLARVGHIASSFSTGTTPLLEKFRDILKRLPLSSANKVSSEIVYKLQQAHTFDVEYAFNRDTVGLSKTLGRGVVFVTIQSDAKNSELATLEAAINKEVLDYLLSEEFIKDNLVEPGSNTILEDIALLIAHSLQPKKHQKPKAHKKSPKEKGTLKIHDKSRPQGFAPPRLRDTNTGKFTSLVTLQSIINSQLSKQVEENMGDGTRTDILNYQTGRFAESVQVVKLTQGRQGMLTAYYTYMKYPYATFSQGGKQEKPRSRDPKLLISRSIREIAQQHVANRMRAVLL
jgi:hypothetical protein